MDVLAGATGDLEAVGAATRAVDVPSDPGSACFGLRLRPGAGAVVFGLDADELVDQTVPLDGVWSARQVRSLAPCLAADELGAAVERLQHAVLAVLLARRELALAPDP